MKLLVEVALAMFLFFDPGTIGKVNTLKSEAKEAFKSGDFKTAIAKYKYLVDSLGVNEDEVTMNLAHAYFQSQDTLQAANTYLPLSQSTDNHIKSLANQQLGVLANRQGKLEEALQYFKQALKAAPANEDARFNYEMVKKKLEDQKQQQQNQDKDKKDQKDNKDQKKDQQNKDQKDQQDKKDEQNKDQKNKDQKDQEQKDKKDQKDQEQQKKDQQEKEKKEQQKAQEKEDQKKDQKEVPPSVSEKLKDMQMSEEKAKMILEAMKNQEKQYLQQNKRKAIRPKDKGKPDW